MNDGLESGSGDSGDPGNRPQRADGRSWERRDLQAGNGSDHSLPLPTIAGYELLGELGHGTMGVVYKARQTALNRLVALKMIVAGGHATAEQLSRFEVEARSVAAIQHPNIVQIHEFGHADGLPYLSLEFVDGSPLDAAINGTPQPPDVAVRLIETLARAMSVAHHHGIVHRDLKPANVLLATDGTPKITDFGLAKQLESTSSQTRSGSQVGTPSYMAPEQAMGELFGSLVDVYALGAILYEMLVGRPPFLGASPYETTMLVVNEEPVRPSLLVAPMPVDVETICLKCLQKEPARRYADAGALAEDCRRFLAGEPILSRPISSAERTWRWCRRNPRTAGLAAAVVGLLALVAVGSTAAALSIAQARNEAVDSKNTAVVARIAADSNAKLAAERAADALSSIQTLVDKVQTQLENAPGTETLKKELLNTALEDLRKLAAKWKDSRSTETTELAAHMRLGNTFRRLGTTAEAMQEYLLCHTIAWRRARDYPDNDAAQGNLAAVLSMLGDMRHELEHDMAASLDCHRQSLEIWKGLHGRPRSREGKVEQATVTRNLAEASIRLAVALLREGKPTEAAPLIQETIDLRRGLVKESPEDLVLRQDLARSYQAMGEVTYLLGDADRSREFYALCLSTTEEVVATRSDDIGAKVELASALGNFAEIRLRSGDYDAARLDLERGLAINREVLALDEGNVDQARNVGIDFHRLGVVESMAGNAEQSARWLNEALQIRERIAAIDPANDERQIELMLTLARLGAVARATAIADALHSPTADPELLVGIARCKAQGSDHLKASDAATSDSLANQAIEAIAKAIEAGYRDRVTLTSEPDLLPLKSRPAFDAIISAIPAP